MINRYLDPGLAKSQKQFLLAFCFLLFGFFDGFLLAFCNGYGFFTEQMGK